MSSGLDEAWNHPKAMMMVFENPALFTLATAKSFARKMFKRPEWSRMQLFAMGEVLVDWWRSEKEYPEMMRWIGGLAQSSGQGSPAHMLCVRICISSCRANMIYAGKVRARSEEVLGKLEAWSKGENVEADLKKLARRAENIEWDGHNSSEKHFAASLRWTAETAADSNSAPTYAMGSMYSSVGMDQDQTEMIREMVPSFPVLMEGKLRMLQGGGMVKNRRRR